MYKVLLVDDEEIILEGLKLKIDWDGLGLTLIGKARNGDEAWQLFETMSPDIVLTDIRMPGMDGLHLVKRIKTTKPDAICIVLSGFSDFTYAQEAIKYGVKGYLLKPIQNEELYDELKRAVDRLNEKEMDYAYVQSLRDSFNRNEIGKMEIEMTKLIMEGAEGDITIPFFDSRESSEFAILLFAIEDRVYPHLNFAEEERHLLWFCIKNVVEECLSIGQIKAVVFKHAINPYELVVMTARNSRLEERQYRIWLEKAIAEIQKLLRLPVTVGVGNWVIHARGLPRSYSEASYAVKASMLHGAGRVYMHRRVEKQGQARALTSAITPVDESILLLMLENRNVDGLDAWIVKQFAEMIKRESSDYSDVETFVVQLQQIYQKFLVQRGFDYWVVLGGDSENIALSMSQESDWRLLHAHLLQAGKVAAELEGDGEKRTGKEIVDEVRKHIDLNYRDNLTLQWVSQTYYIQSTYFSRIFREKVGMTFLDYITKVRMENALRLIKETSQQIQSIAQMVGYDNPPYFSMVFRKTYGVSPVQARETR